MDKDVFQEIPYRRVTTIVVLTLFAILISIGHSQWFPIWCLYSIYACFVILPFFWTVHALIHHRKKAALVYLMMGVVLIILFLLYFIILLSAKLF